MPIQHVRQVHSSGCFIACLAMLLNKTYDEAFTLVYPEMDPMKEYDAPGLKSNHIDQAATEVMEKLGFKVKRSKYKKLKSLMRYARKHALLIIRWRWGGDAASTEDNPWLCHAVVFDADSKKFLDPASYGREIKLSSYQKQLDSIFYVEVPAAA